MGSVVPGVLSPSVPAINVVAPPRIPGVPLPGTPVVTVTQGGSGSSRLEWIDADSLTLEYATAGKGLPNYALRGRVGVRNKGSNTDEEINFTLFRSRTELWDRDDVQNRTTKVQLLDTKPKLVDLILELPSQCGFHPAAFHDFPFASFDKPSGCFPLRGYIVAENHPMSAAATKDDSIPQQNLLAWSAPMPLSAGLGAEILKAAGLWAGILVGLAMVIAWILGHAPWSVMEGAPNWDFSKSWATNTTLAGGLLSAILALTSLSPVLLQRSTYTFLDLWATALLSLGPTIYSAFTWQNTATPPITCSRVLGFFLGSFFVLWAALVQVRIVRVLISELALDKSITPDGERLIGQTINAIAFILIAYAGYALIRIVTEQAQKRAAGTVSRPRWSLI